MLSFSFFKIRSFLKHSRQREIPIDTGIEMKSDGLFNQQIRHLSFVTKIVASCTNGLNRDANEKYNRYNALNTSALKSVAYLNILNFLG